MDPDSDKGGVNKSTGGEKLKVLGGEGEKCKENMMLPNLVEPTSVKETRATNGSGITWISNMDVVCFVVLVINLMLNVYNLKGLLYLLIKMVYRDD